MSPWLWLQVALGVPWFYWSGVFRVVRVVRVVRVDRLTGDVPTRLRQAAPDLPEGQKIRDQVTEVFSAEGLGEVRWHGGQL